MQNGILKGVDKIIDEILEVESIGTTSPHYLHKTACDQLHRVPLKNFDANLLLTKVYDKIENNWKGRLRKKPPSPENWRFEPKTRIDPRNKSLEIQLQRAIVKIEENMPLDARKWTNHVPTASGLWDHKCDKHRAIDLVHVSPGQGRYDAVEFIELKVNRSAGHPVYAAIEVLLYGMLYIFSRRELEYDVTEKPLLRANEIHLVVLAPFRYFDGYQFDWLEEAISNGLRRFALKSVGCKMDFQFQTFPWDCSINKIISNEALLIEALKGRKGIEDIRQQWRDETKRLEYEVDDALAIPRSWAEKSKTRRAQARRASAKGQIK